MSIVFKYLKRYKPKQEIQVSREVEAFKDEKIVKQYRERWKPYILIPLGIAVFPYVRIFETTFPAPIGFVQSFIISIFFPPTPAKTSFTPNTLSLPCILNEVIIS